jgi:sugar phosphate permease
MTQENVRLQQIKVGATGFLSLFSIVGIAFYGLPFFYDFWLEDFGWSRAVVTSGNAVGKIILALFAFLTGWIVDRLGPRRVMLVGIVLGGLALIGLSRMASLWHFYFFYFLNALAYMSAGPLPNQVLISRWFDRARGKAMGIAYIGIGVGGMLVPIIANFLNQSFGWHNAIMILGFMIVAIPLPLIWFIKDQPETRIISSMPEEGKIPFKTILKKRNVYLLMIGSMLSIAAVAGTTQNLKLFFTFDLDYTQSQSARIMSLVLASSIVGRLLMGWLADRLPKKYVMILIFTLVSCSIPLLFTAKTPGMIYVFAFTFGIALGGDYMIIPLMAAELFGVRILGKVMGIVISADVVGEALSPVLVGWLRDRSDSYTTAFLALVILAILGVIAISLLPRRGGLMPEMAPLKQ